MRSITAALLSAAAILPSLAHATTTKIPDPSDAAAPVPAITYPSAFDGYRPYRDGDGPTWQQLNQIVQNKPAAVRGTMQGGARGNPAGNATPNHAMHGDAAK